MRGKLVAGAGILLLSGCVTYPRGNMAAVSTELLPIGLRVVTPEVEGRSCGAARFDFLRDAFAEALDAALDSAPGANGLLDVSYRVENLCLVVRGTAVRVE